MNKNMGKPFIKFILLCSGSFVAAIGSGITSFGLGVYVFEQTGLASSSTLIILLAFLPGLLLTPFAGVLADKYDRRLLMILGDGLSALGLIYILICMMNGPALLWQIGLGVTISSVFSSLIEPAFKATITDLLTEEEYSKASGLVQLSGSAKFLISPLIAGFLLQVSDIKLLLMIDICTIFLTVMVTFVVRRGLAAKASEYKESFFHEFRTGLTALTQNRGVFTLVLSGISISFFLGCIQSLYTPMILGFTDSKVLGAATTISAMGMLVSSLILGMIPIKKGFTQMLFASLFLAGIFMAGYGFKENIILICIFGFLFFSMLPFANTSIDYLIRTNISNDVQGRVWGLIGIISQLGYVIAYSILGPLADYVFIPLLIEDGVLANSMGKVIGVGSSRGIGLLIMIAGLLLSVTAILLYNIKSVRGLERGGELCTEKIIINDVKKSKLITITITAFILLAAMLTSLAAMLSVNLFSAINSMMLRAETPHFMQMHSGDINMERLSAFADTENNVEDFQVLSFLNIEGAEIVIGENSLAGSVQDNGLSVQSKRFDYLLGLDGNIIYPAKGEIYVPIYYMKQGLASIGDSITIHGVSFTVAGYLRDSQMNASMISSKRFLINESDFEKVRKFGKLEYLIEFRFSDNSAVSAFESDYIAAGLPANGPPAITHSLFKLVNALDDGMMIAMLILISVLVIIINFLCIRFTLLAKVEEDYREIGVLKAIGLQVRSIKKLYLAKYGAIAGIACIAGFLLSLFVKEPLMENIRLYMGEGGSSGHGTAFGMIGAGIIFLVVVLYVNVVLCRFKKVSAAEAIRFGAPQSGAKTAKGFRLSGSRGFPPNIFLGIKDVLSRKKLYSTMLLVLVLSSFLMIVPQNIYNTISQRNFMTYMGIGECDMRIDIQQTDDIGGKTSEIAAAMARDTDIKKYTVLTSYMFDMQMEDSTTEKLKVELGDQSVFPIEYSAGRAPQNESEIAISSLVAGDLEKGLNDIINLMIDGQQKRLAISGIYSDITNGGKTAKAVFKTSQDSILWSIIPVKLQAGAAADEKITGYKEQFSYAKVSDIDEYIGQTFGGITDAVKKASYAAIAAAAMLTVLVTLLFMKMLVTKDRYSIAVLKSLGFKKEDICRQYMVRPAIVLAAGVLIGTVLANTLGELVGVGLISSFGASTFRFNINPLFAYLCSPALMAVCVYLATWFGISDISGLKISEYIKE